MRIMEMPSGERPREKLLKSGKESLSTAELIALILGSGSKGKSSMEVAMELMSKDSRGLGYMADCTPEELMTVEGVGYAKACNLLASVELGRRIATLPRAERPSVSGAKDIADMFMERMRHYKKEHFLCVLLNTRGEIIEEVSVSVGDLSSSTTHPREVFVDAVRRSAGSVIFLHNHPSGDPTPSNADKLTTQRLIQVGELLGIPVLDHIVIGDGRYISMKAEGYM